MTVVRDAAGHISGFQGTATVFADAPYNDGGLTYGPEGVLFATRWPRNELQQTRPGSAAADKVIDLTALGVQHASASLNFVPRGLPGAGALKLVSWSGGQWYTLGLRADGGGHVRRHRRRRGLTLPGGPEGFVYVAAGSPLFTADSMLVSEWSANQIAVYEIDDKGDPQARHPPQPAHRPARRRGRLPRSRHRRLLLLHLGPGGRPGDRRARLRPDRDRLVGWREAREPDYFRSDCGASPR